MTPADLDALIERQPWFPPADERTEWANQAAAALVQLREEAASWEAQVTDRDEMCLQQAARAERAESRANELEQARESIEEFSHAKTDEILRLRADNEHWQDRCLAYQTERDALREFVADMFEAAEWPEGGDIDGGQFQELATKHGILAEEERIAPCEGRESCWCSDYGGPGPTTCYRKAQWLAAPDKEQT